MSLKQKIKIGCASLTVLLVALWIVVPKFSTPSDNPPAVMDNAPVVTYTFEQQQGALKSWIKDFESKTDTVNEQWKKVNEIVEVSEQQGIHGNLDGVQKNLENLEGTYSSLQPPKELTTEQQNSLKQVSSNMDESISSRVKYIRYTEAYYLNQRNINYRKSQEQKQLIDLYHSSSSAIIKELAETYKIQY